jgi:hypothetical protein
MSSSNSTARWAAAPISASNKPLRFFVRELPVRSGERPAFANEHKRYDRRWSVFLVAALLASSLTAESVPGGEMASSDLATVLKNHTGRLMAIPGVVGTAETLCEGKPCIKVYVEKKTPDIEQQIPPAIEGYPVVIQETGTVRPLQR